MSPEHESPNREAPYSPIGALFASISARGQLGHFWETNSKAPL